MTEQEALSKLGAKDWRSLNKGQIMSFLFETAPNLSDEVRLRILEAAPDILNTANTVLSEYQDTARKALEQNQEVTGKILDQNHTAAGAMFVQYNKTSETLNNLLSDPNASFEEKQYWSNELFKYLREMREYEKDNKAFLGEVNKTNKGFLDNVLKYAGVAAIVMLGGAIAALTGGKLNILGKS